MPQQQAPEARGPKAIAQQAYAHQAAEDPHSDVPVDVNDPASVQRWAVALGTTVDALEGAVKAVGPQVDKIKDYLTGGMAGKQEDA